MAGLLIFGAMTSYGCNTSVAKLDRQSMAELHKYDNSVTFEKDFYKALTHISKCVEINNHIVDYHSENMSAMELQRYETTLSILEKTKYNTEYTIKVYERMGQGRR